MQTSELINQLSTGVKPVSRYALLQRVLLYWLAGVAAALLLLLLAKGVRGDLREAICTWPFWIKWGYTGSSGLIALILSIRIARPDANSGRSILWLLLPLMLLLAIAMHDWQQAPAEMTHKLWLGHSALMCPWNIAALAIPVFVSMMLIMRKLAPTQLRLAGFIAGCAAGASGASVYALLCNESATPFILAWYSLGMVLPGLLGMILGPRLLRW